MYSSDIGRKMELIKDEFCNMEIYQHNDQITVLGTCFGCDQVIEPHSWYYAGRDDVGFALVFHKYCAELPKYIDSHPLHPCGAGLQISIPSNYHPHPPCEMCHRVSSDPKLMYGCRSCSFFVDLMCYGDEILKLLALAKSSKERKRMALKDHIHNHQLKLLQIIQSHQDDDDEDDVAHDDSVGAVIQQCKACLQPIEDSSYYICTEESEECKDYCLHKYCGELPLEMEHDLHTLHPLMLMTSPPQDHFKCATCREFCKGYIYSCRTCYFHLDIICATTASRLLEHKCHQHPLKLLPISNSSLFCSACCKVHEQGMFYQCNTCVAFFIHKDCASFPCVIEHPSHQGHPLYLGYQLNGTQKRNDCDICYKKIYEQSGWFYYCWECKFFSHFSCITSDSGREILKIDPKIPCLPWEDTDNEFGTVGLWNRIRSIQNKKGREMDKITHFSHPEHPLILHHDVPKEANPFSDGEMTLTTQCNGCCKQISAPLYSCAACQYYIHKGCALLPTYIAQHHAHSYHRPSRLVLVREPWYETRALNCYDCNKYYNGFSYHCERESCEYQIDVECALIPIRIVHKAHPFHTLSLVGKNADRYKYGQKMYNCCSDLYNGGYIYKCDACKFQIHPRCAMYPSKAYHRFDCDSPFMLCYSPSKIEPNEYHYCDICEKILNPKLWFYFSSQMGGTIMHPGCLLLSDSVAVNNPNFKSISSILEVDIHPHRLHCYPTSHFTTCYLCHKCMIYPDNNTGGQLIDFEYRCVESGCKYQIHISCGNRFILQAEEGSKENADTGNYSKNNGTKHAN